MKIKTFLACICSLVCFQQTALGEKQNTAPKNMQWECRVGSMPYILQSLRAVRNALDAVQFGQDWKLNSKHIQRLAMDKKAKEPLWNVQIGTLSVDSTQWLQSQILKFYEPLKNDLEWFEKNPTLCPDHIFKQLKSMEKEFVNFLNIIKDLSPDITDYLYHHAHIVWRRSQIAPYLINLTAIIKKNSDSWISDEAITISDVQNFIEQCFVLAQQSESQNWKHDLSSKWPTADKIEHYPFTLANLLPSDIYAALPPNDRFALENLCSLINHQLGYAFDREPDDPRQKQLARMVRRSLESLPDLDNETVESLPADAPKTPISNKVVTLVSPVNVQEVF